MSKFLNGASVELQYDEGTFILVIYDADEKLICRAAFGSDQAANIARFIEDRILGTQAFHGETPKQGLPEIITLPMERGELMTLVCAAAFAQAGVSGSVGEQLIALDAFQETVETPAGRIAWRRLVRKIYNLSTIVFHQPAEKSNEQSKDSTRGSEQTGSGPG